MPSCAIRETQTPQDGFGEYFPSAVPPADAALKGRSGLSPAIPDGRKGSDVTGPSWLAGTFAAVMILIAAYSAGRLVVSRRRGRATEFDADALHVVMGGAMAGMLVPQLNVLPDRAWVGVFTASAAWFGWHAVRGGGRGSPRCRYPVPHLIECAAMLFMLLPAARFRPAHAGSAMAMPGMGVSAGSAAGFPVLAAVLALFMLGYMVWTTDRLTTLARAKTAAANLGVTAGHPPEVAAAAAGSGYQPAGAPVTPGATRARPDGPADRPMLAPKLAACCKIAMSIAMGYMLILML